MVQLIIQGRNLEITPKVREYVEKRMARLNRQLADTAEVHVDLSEERARNQQDRHGAQITIRRNGSLLRAETKEADLFASIDAAIDKMDRQLGRFKDKRRRKGLLPVAAAPVPEVLGEEEADLEEEQAEENARIVRTKRFPMRPMDPQEAIEQMELLGHDFFVFFNAQTSGVNVVYRRKGGDYGLLQPEMA